MNHLIIHVQLTDTFVSTCAGLFVNPVNKYILSNSKLDTCCTIVEAEEPDSDCDNNEITKTEMSDTLSKASAATTATLPIPHFIHIAHHIYYYMHHWIYMWVCRG